MAPLVKDSKQFESKLDPKTSLHDELLKKLKLEEEKEKKKLEKESKRRAELEKMKQESLQMQAALTTSSKGKNKKQNIQPKKLTPLAKQKGGSSSFASKSRSTSVSKENDKSIWCESLSSNSAEHGGWTSQHNSYNSKAKPSSYSKQTSFTSKSKYNQGSSYERSRSRCDSSSSENQYRRSRYTPASDSWNSDEQFPALGEAPVPKVNVWAQRISQAEAIKALEPQTLCDEEAMLRQALELSMKEAQEEELKRKFEEELLLQAQTLEVSPKFNEVLDDFKQTSDSEYESSTLHFTKNQWTMESNSGYSNSFYVDKREENANSRGAKDQWIIESNSVCSNSSHSGKRGDDAENQWTVESNSGYSSSSHVSKREDDVDSRDAKHQWTAESYSNSNSTSYVGKKEKNGNTRGAKSKLNKIIDSFGGWGLSNSDKRIEKRSEKLSDFVDEVVREKHKSIEYHNDVTLKKNALEKGEKQEDFYSNNPLHPWASTESENVKESIPVTNTWENKEIIYDGKGTFTDFVDDAEDFDSAKDNQHDTFCDSNVVVDEETKEEVTKIECQEMCKSSKNKRFDSRIEDTDSMDYMKPFESKNILSYNSIKKKESFDSDSYNVTDESFKNSQTSTKIECQEMYEASGNERFDSRIEDTDSTVCMKPFEIKNILSSDSIKEKKSFDSDSYNATDDSFKNSENSAPKDIFQLEHEILNLPSKGPNEFPSDQSVSDGNSFCDRLNPKNELGSNSFQFFSAENNDFVPVISDLDSNAVSSHILPPHPAPSIPDTNINGNTFFANGIPVPSNQTKSPILASQPAFQPQFPFMNPLLPNFGMFPGGMNFNPMMGYVMDPMMQMLMLRNPFFANQLLSMEQYFKAQGIATDVFSMHSQAVANPFVSSCQLPQQPNMFGHVMNPTGSYSQFQTGVPSNDLNSQFQSEVTSNDLIPPPKTALDSSSDELHVKHSLPPGLNTDINHSGMASEVRLDDDDDEPWFKSYFSNDSSFSIPPPKLPAAEVNPIAAPKPVSNKNTSGFSQNISGNVIMSAYPTSNVHKIDDSKPLAVESSVTKPSKSAWSDDESIETCSSKWSDGWGDDAVASRSVKQSSKYEDNWGHSYRQPASQPQFSHLRQNRMNK